MSEKICIYHGNCADGFGSAWAVRKYHQFWNIEQPEFYAGVYGQEPPNVIGKEVIIVDFSYKRPVLLKMAEAAKTILIIDHHKTAQEDLVGLPDNVTTVFDMKRSGAALTWMYYFKGSEPPFLLRHIEDRDLWKFDLPATREIQAAVFSHPYNFEVWDKLAASFDEFGNTSLINEGAAIERKHFKDIDELLGVTQREMKIAGHFVPVANLPYTLTSDAANKMARGKPFAACYWDTPNGRSFGLRSAADGVDVSKVAEQYGGGGHKHAAGFSVSFNQAFEFEVTK